MKYSTSEVVRLTKLCRDTFRSFGGGQGSTWGNPIAEALRDAAPQFAAGVDIGDVVGFVLHNYQPTRKDKKASHSKRKAKR